MKERPIIFSGPMVRAILDGRKTQTRRVVKPQPLRISSDWDEPAEPGETVIRHGWPTRLVESRGRNKSAVGILTPVEKKCPHGEPGDRLWVRETFTCSAENEAMIYRADGERFYAATPAHRAWLWGKAVGQVIPSIHMPRWASCITLEVLDVRVERVQDISETDAISEGLTEYFWPDDLHPEARARIELRKSKGERFWKHVIKKRSRRSSVWHSAILAYKEFWNDINAKRKPVMDKGKIVSYVSYPWKSTIWDTCEHRGKPWVVVANPWVWVVEFKVKES